VILLAISFSVSANSIEIYTFDNKQQEKVYHSLTQDLRCLVCQNQNIAESNAELAKDMRRKTYEMVKQGKSEKEISAFMVTRYGDFVLYRPPFEPMTWLLWLGPLIIFIIGIIFVVRFMKSQKRDAQVDSLSEEEIERIKNLHAEQDKR
jgi:cytochrome c-type biogenesis protein CcmH